VRTADGFSAAGKPENGARSSRVWWFALASLAAIRFLTIAPDAWNWDEVLLADAVAQGIDLREHRPHPPGYPLLVEAATLVHRCGVDPYRSLAVVGTAGGLLAIASLAAFLRAAGLPPNFARLGALLYAFIPSVWLFGVRGFSDPPAAAAGFAAGAAFLAGWRATDSRLTALGIALTAVAAGFRPQCAVALLPLGVASIIFCLRKVPRSWRWLLSGLAAGLAVTLLVWLPAIAGSGGFDSYRAHLSIQASEVRRSDLLAPGALLSPAVWRRWLLDPFGSDPLFWAYAVLAVGAAWHRRFTLRLLSVLVPWTFVNVPASALFAAPRCGTFLLAGLAGLAAGGLAVLSRRFARFGMAAGMLLAGIAAAVGLPAVLEVAGRPSPPVEAIEAVRRGELSGGTILHDPALRMHVARLLPSRERGEIAADRAVVANAGDTVLAADRVVPGLLDGRRFAYRHAKLLARLSHGMLLSVHAGVATPGLSVGARAAEPGTESVRYDNDIPVAVDQPGDGELVRTTLRVTGWCQLRGGGAVEPLEFRVDGEVVPSVRAGRTPRPDVSSAIPSIGDASRAGFEALLDVSALSPGRHLLRVTFRAADGRRRISGPVRFLRAP
jgi:hypothetical protein